MILVNVTIAGSMNQTYDLSDVINPYKSKTVNFFLLKI